MVAFLVRHLFFYGMLRKNEQKTRDGRLSEKGIARGFRPTWDCERIRYEEFVLKRRDRQCVIYAKERGVLICAPII